MGRGTTANIIPFHGLLGDQAIGINSRIPGISLLLLPNYEILLMPSVEEMDQIRSRITTKTKPKVDAGEMVGHLWKYTDSFVEWLKEFIQSNQKAKLIADSPNDFQIGFQIFIHQ